MKILSSLFILIYSASAFTYVLSKTETGSNVKWTKANKNLNFYVNPTPLGNATSNISTDEALSIIQNSIDEWNSVSEYQINPTYTSNIPVVGSSKTISFSDDSRYFDSGVVAVTKLSYNATSGDISTADILINDSYYYLGSQKITVTEFTDSESSSSGSNSYLGDVLTHEIGHSLGLSHSEHVNSSMVYSIFKGQHSIHTDDIAGIYELYSIDKNIGEISGRVITGNSVPVFGVRVTAISTVSGDPVQSQLSDEVGEYRFNNLPLDDSYYIMVSPYKNLSNISTTGSDGSQYYSTPKYNFCSQSDFKASFYTQCGPRTKGSPQAFFLDSSSSTLDVGDVTIRCDENLNSNYYAQKSETSDRAVELNDNTNKSSFLFTGIFSDSEIADGTAGLGDEFTIDLSEIETNGVSANNYVLRLKLLSTGIDSAMDFQILTKRDDEASYQTYTSSTDSSGKTITDFEVSLSMSSTTDNNIFSIKVYPVDLTSTQKYEIFSALSALSNNSSQYILNAQVGKYSSSVFTPLNTLDSYPYEDNSSCTEGEATYTVAAHTSLSSAVSNAGQLPVDDDIAGVTCGTIDIDDDSNSNGMGSFIVGIFLILLMSSASNLKREY